MYVKSDLTRLIDVQIPGGTRVALSGNQQKNLTELLI